MGKKRIKVLLVEDTTLYARIVQKMLGKLKGGSFELEWVKELLPGLERLSMGGIDVVLLDLNLPDSRGLNTFIRTHAHAPEVPIVVLTGIDDETTATRAMQKGAQDYLVKGKVDSGLLSCSIRYAIERERLIRELKGALLKIKTLSGLLPICASCKNIRDDKGRWNRLEDYISERSMADFTHGICPECARKLYPEVYKKKRKPRKPRAPKKR